MKPASPRPRAVGRVDWLTFARFVPVPENQSAWAAFKQTVDHLLGHPGSPGVNPLFLHGPAGTGKTHLVWALVRETTRGRSSLSAQVCSAGDIRPLAELGEADAPLAQARDCDLLVVEDLQNLATRSAETLVGIHDALLARRQQMIFTASVGPGHLKQLPARLTSRLAAGLVLGITGYSAASRLALLRDKAQRQQLAVPADTLAWLADHLIGGGRQLEGAIESLKALSHSLDLATVARHFADQAETTRPTVERIAERVGKQFQVDPRQMQSSQRHRRTLLPRQVSMYLARQLTGLSLGEIGKYFGGRDHSTVLHACQKVDQAMNQDVVLSGTIRQLQADLV